MASETTSDDELLRRSARGDARAFSEFYRRHEVLVVGYLMRRVKDPEVTADLTAETFATAFVAAGKFRPIGPDAIGWLLRIAQRNALMHWRTGEIEQRARQRLQIEAVAYADDSLERIETLADLSNAANPLLLALDALPASQRDSVRARVLEERSYAEISTAHGVSQAVVRQRVRRGLDRLRTVIDGERT